ncbi:ROK family protein [Deinococcus maricopensis]|uniref:Glucokinase n=1 Tax=Deinococcus maricopensis (strain DSM 21211 / LMG 22137 / NRRL B-23946 / LB-34) TaxID=709986 RepID=E8U3H0_DEIML|nr:ROK family protein [Deinococcus maricopensis]ADV65841.1 Glucokinase [Deinococcus maricopensis DSM 21211]
MRLLSKRVRQDREEVLELVFWLGRASRVQLMQITGWSKTKVLSVVAELLETRWLTESEPLASTGGRRASSLTLNGRRGCVLGVALGATSLVVTLSDLNRAALDQRTQRIERLDDVEGVTQAILGACRDLLRRVECGALVTVGVGVPGPVDARAGALISPPLMPSWDGFPLRDTLQRALGAPVYVDNDVNVLALGELERQRRGAAAWHGDETFIVVKLGTGIGAGIISHGDLHRGADGAAGDIGHIIVAPHGPPCHCGNTGCLEAVAGAAALVRAAEQAARTGLSPLLAEALRDRGALQAPDIAAAAHAGDAAANTVIRQAGTHVGQVLAGLTNFFNPRALYLGGGVSDIGLSLLSSVRQNVYAHSLPLSTRQLTIDHLPDKRSAGQRGTWALGMMQAIREEQLT